MIQDFHMPIITSEHFYLLCINVQKKCVHLVDNMDTLSGTDGIKILLEAKYEAIYDFMMNTFIDLLRSKMINVPETSKLYKQVMSLSSWKDNASEKNVIDRGVYLLRHIKTYEIEYHVRSQEYQNGIPTKGPTGRTKSHQEEKINSLRF